MDPLKLALDIQALYLASIARGHTRAYLEGAQIGRLGLSIEMCQYAEQSPQCMDWRRGYFNELSKLRGGKL